MMWSPQDRGRTTQRIGNGPDIPGGVLNPRFYRSTGCSPVTVGRDRSVHRNLLAVIGRGGGIRIRIRFRIRVRIRFLDGQGLS